MPSPARRVLPTRLSGRQVRRQPVRRASPRLGATQIYALVLMALCVATIVSLGSSPIFGARHLEIHGATFTSQETVRQIVGIDGAPNLFRLRTDRIAAALIAQPAVQSATVDVSLPDTLIVTLVEREPKLIWVIGERRFVVDSDGLLFGQVDAAGNPIPPAPGAAATQAPPSESPTQVESSEPSGGSGAGMTPSDAAAGVAAPKATPMPRPAAEAAPGPTATPKPGPSASPTASLAPPPSLLPAPTPDPAVFAGPDAVAVPVVFDRASADRDLALGGYVDPIDLDAGYRLAGLTPGDVGSQAAALTVVLDDEHGFTLSSGSGGWVAQFGFYTQTLRKDTVIPEQVRDLRSLLAEYGEKHVAWVFLMADLSDVHINTYIPK
jgi:hypothetical protein